MRRSWRRLSRCGETTLNRRTRRRRSTNAVLSIVAIVKRGVQSDFSRPGLEYFNFARNFCSTDALAAAILCARRRGQVAVFPKKMGVFLKNYALLSEKTPSRPCRPGKFGYNNGSKAVDSNRFTRSSSRTRGFETVSRFSVAGPLGNASARTGPPRFGWIRLTFRNQCFLNARCRKATPVP